MLTNKLAINRHASSIATIIQKRLLPLRVGAGKRGPGEGGRSGKGGGTRSEAPNGVLSSMRGKV
jgi:hypothetical protein